MCCAVAADQNQVSSGGDLFVSGARPEVATGAPRDVFLAGFSPSLSGVNSGDAHVAGFDVLIAGEIGKDLYVAGSSVNIMAEIGEDLTASGFTLRLDTTASVQGNARIAAATATLNAPVNGSLVISGGDVRLNSTISGDVRLSAATVEFGSNARIAGNLWYSAIKQVDISADVIAPDRVRFTPLSSGDHRDEWSDTFSESLRSFWPRWLSALSVFLLTIGFLLAVGAVLLAMIPERIERLHDRVIGHPGKMMLAGVVGLAVLIGIIPVSVMTLVGIPLIPFVLLTLLVVWTLGYLLGVYAVSLKVSGSLTGDPISHARRLFILAIGLLVFALLNFIPFLGWLLNLSVVLTGLGAMTVGVLNRYCERSTLINEKPLAV